jgi:hypothetical protein
MKYSYIVPISKNKVKEWFEEDVRFPLDKNSKKAIIFDKQGNTIAIITGRGQLRFDKYCDEVSLEEIKEIYQYLESKEWG